MKLNLSTFLPAVLAAMLLVLATGCDPRLDLIDCETPEGLVYVDMERDTCTALGGTAVGEDGNADPRQTDDDDAPDNPDDDSTSTTWICWEPDEGAEGYKLSNVYSVQFALYHHSWWNDDDFEYYYTPNAADMAAGWMCFEVADNTLHMINGEVEASEIIVWGTEWLFFYDATADEPGCRQWGQYYVGNPAVAFQPTLVEWHDGNTVGCDGVFDLRL